MLVYQRVHQKLRPPITDSSVSRGPHFLPRRGAGHSFFEILSILKTGLNKDARTKKTMPNNGLLVGGLEHVFFLNEFPYIGNKNPI